MISKQNRAVLITNRGGKIYNYFPKYDIIYNLNTIRELSSTCVYKDDVYKFSACLYYSYYVVLHLIDENLERKVQ